MRCSPSFRQIPALVLTPRPGHPWFRRVVVDGVAVVPRKPVVWEDLATGKFHAVNNETGEEVPCDRDGRPVAQFHLGVSGTASTKTRMQLRLKVRRPHKLLTLPDCLPHPPAGLSDAPSAPAHRRIPLYKSRC